MEKNDLEIKDEELHVNDFTQEELVDDTFDWKSKSLELLGNQKRKNTQLKNAKAKLVEYETELTELRTLKEKNKLPEKKVEKSDEFGLLEKAFLKASGFTDAEEIELFKKWHDETNKSYDELVDHPFVKAELEQMRTAKTNKIATDNIKGEDGSNKGGAKDSPEYWIAKATTGSDGKLMFPDDLPLDRKLRAAIAEKLIEKQKVGKKFYND